jgi:hypothetical protein
MGQLVGYKVVNPSRQLLSPQSFLKIFEFQDDHERQYVRYISKLALADKVRIHLLTDIANKPIAFIALSIETISSSPCLVINYLFCSVSYRKLNIDELKGKKISNYLIAHAIQIIHEMTPHIPIHYLALQPAHEKLERFYADLGFTRLHRKEWMFLKI